MSGNWATGNWARATSPRTTNMMEMTMATIGRFMKNVDTEYLLLCTGLAIAPDVCLPVGRLLGRSKRCYSDGRALSRLLEPFDNDPLTLVQPLVYNPEVVDPLRYFDSPDVHPVVRAYNGDLIASLEFTDGSLRHEERCLL